MNINPSTFLSGSEDSKECSLQKETLPDTSSLIPILEALLFTSQKALSLKELLSLIKAAAATSPEEAPGAFATMKEQKILEALQLLRDELSNSTRSYELRETASGWQLVTKSFFAPWLRQLFPEARPSRLSAPALETLAIIAYRQPITRADLEAVRGVAVDGVVQTLLDRGLIHIAGRAEIPGRPLLYATSQFFLDHFGLRSLEELPNAVELGKITLPKAATPAIAPTQEEKVAA
ncbi:MAG: SMC-Scp complex subunit ScpB [Chthoniobacterales bacterium]